jgi:RNA polymerase sigma-54 factor
MQKLKLAQQLNQKLSPQQIQFIKLLQVPTTELESRIETELESNPALDEGKDQEEFEDTDEHTEESTEDINVDEFVQNEDWGSYKTKGDSYDPNQETREKPLVENISMTDLLLSQVGYLRLDKKQLFIAEHLVGSLDDAGYLRRDLESIEDDLLFTQNMKADVEELREVLLKIQTFEPSGVGAQDLQECLLIQLDRMITEPAVRLAYSIIDEHFSAFTKKHYDKIEKALDIDDEELKAALEIITKLNPRPGGSSSANTIGAQYVVPDFYLKIDDDNKISITMNSRNTPDLKVSKSFSNILNEYKTTNKKDKKLRETASFVKKKLDSAKWFIDAIEQRKYTLLNTMQTIVKLQHDFFIEGDESYLKPMILRDVAEKINMDVSTVSRVVNSKSVQTDFGVYSLKYFFSESISTESGIDVSNKEVKNELKKLVETEEKFKPLSDDKLVKLLNTQGYNLARRTVAKYREQMSIPVARLRKEL